MREKCVCRAMLVRENMDRGNRLVRIICIAKVGERKYINREVNKKKYD